MSYFLTIFFELVNCSNLQTLLIVEDTFRIIMNKKYIPQYPKDIKNTTKLLQHIF